MSVGYRVHAVRTMARRELRSTLYGLGLYVTLSVVFLLMSVGPISNALNHIRNNGIEVFANPITVPFFLTVGLVAAYLGLCSALAISRERDQGTLEVLFYGPVDSVAYVLAKYAHQVLAFLVALALGGVYFYVISRGTNLGFSSDFSSLLVLSVFLASCFISFGIFLSAVTRRMMVSVILYVALVLFFLGFSITHAWVMGIQARDLTDRLVFIRVILDSANVVMQWISPLAYLDRGNLALAMGDRAQYLLSVLSSAAYTVVMLILSVILFNRKGVRR